MENDSVRTSGSSTLVDMWIDGKLRAISLSREAIDTFLQMTGGRAGPPSDDDRREFVRTHLTMVVTAATNKLHNTDPDADSVAIDVGQLGGSAGAPPDDRRQGDRRKGDRRKINLGPPPSGERRR